MKRHFFKDAFINILLHPVLILTAVVFSVCSPHNQGPTNAPGTVLSRDLSEYIAGLAPEGWSLDERVYTFSAKNLYERINGRAELYLSYDVVSLTTATFVRDGSSEEFMELSIFDMGVPLNAFGIFSVERFPGEPPLPLGRLSYRSDANIYIWKGGFYIVIVSFSSQEDIRQVNLELASKVVDILFDSDEPVWGLSAFPQENLIRDSIRYFHIDAMGLDFMKNTYTARYQRDGENIQAFISRKETLQAAADTVARYVEYSKNYGHGCTPHRLGDASFKLCDMGDAYDVIFDKGRLVGGVISVADPDTALEFASKFFESLTAGDDSSD